MPLTGTDEIQGLALNLEISEKASFSAQAFENIRRLKLLQLNYVELTDDGYKYLSTNMLSFHQHVKVDVLAWISTTIHTESI